MRRWTFWEWVSYACLFMAAMIMAADTGVKQAPELVNYLPAFIHGPIWGFAPLFFVLAATILLVMHELGWLGVSKRLNNAAERGQLVPKSDRRQWLHSYKILEFADPELKAAHQAERDKHQDATQRIAALISEQNRLQRVADGVKLIGVTSALEEAKIDSRRAADQSERFWSQMWQNIHDKLGSGELVAKGFLKPVSENPSEVYIPTKYWRFLRLTGAYNTADGEGKSYTGIAVARAN